jgi:ribosomal-protein-alanine N-acetyltransferase
MVAQQLIKIRGAEPSDLQAILDIEYMCFSDPYPLGLLQHLYSLHPYGFLVAEIGGKMVGYVIGALRWGRTGHILAIAVNPSYRKQYVGSALMTNILDRLRSRGARHIRLESRKSNVEAQQFYSKMGFRAYEEVPHYYADGEAAIVMGLDF